jgi:hypothetical protein
MTIASLTACTVSVVAAHLGPKTVAATPFDGPNLNERLESLMACEEMFGVRFCSDDINRMRTVGDLALTIARKWEKEPLRALQVNED